MAHGASPQTLDQIRDQLVNRGIGTSGLARQAVGRANLPNLGRSLATASAIRAEEQRRRQVDIQAKQAQNLSQLRQQLGRVGRQGVGRQAPGRQDFLKEFGIGFDRGAIGRNPAVTLGRLDPSDPSNVLARRIDPAGAQQLGVQFENLPSFGKLGFQGRSARDIQGEILRAQQEAKQGGKVVDIRGLKQLFSQLR